MMSIGQGAFAEILASLTGVSYSMANPTLLNGDLSDIVGRASITKSCPCNIQIFSSEKFENSIRIFFIFFLFLLQT